MSEPARARPIAGQTKVTSDSKGTAFPRGLGAPRFDRPHHSRRGQH